MRPQTLVLANHMEMSRKPPTIYTQKSLTDTPAMAEKDDASVGSEIHPAGVRQFVITYVVT